MIQWKLIRSDLVCLGSLLVYTFYATNVSAASNNDCKCVTIESNNSSSSQSRLVEDDWGDFHFEYARGLSLPVRTSFKMSYGNTQVTYHNVKFQDRSFHPDNSKIPVAFIRPLGNLHLVDAFKAFTEPYYGVHLYYFFKSMPNLGLGLDFIHFKVFITDYTQKVRVTGRYQGQSVNERFIIGEHINSFSVSHGINQLGLTGVYRWFFFPSQVEPRGRLQPHVALSAGPCFPHPEIWFPQKVDRNERVKRAFSFQAGFPNLGVGLFTGLRYRFSRHFSWLLEYKFTYSYLQAMHFDYGEPGKIKMNIWDHHFQWGLALIL